MSLLFQAVIQEDHLAISMLLTIHNHNVNELANRDWTPLMISVLKGNIQTVQLLLAHGARVNSETVDGRTAYHEAIDMGHLQIAELLRQAGASTNESIHQMGK